MTKAQEKFLATPVKDLVKISDGGKITIEPCPKGMSDKKYRDHLSSGPRITLRTRNTNTRGKPEHLWGGERATGLEPVSAKICADSYLKDKNNIVDAYWEK